MRTGLHLGRWAGIDVRAHWSVALVAALLGGLLARDNGVWLAVVGVVAFLSSILAHEFGHALTARRFGVGTESIGLWALGGVARLDRDSPTARAEGWIAAAGPLVSLAIAVGGILGWSLLGGRDNGSAAVGLLGWVGFMNAALAVFNLLPGAPLDGGRILKAVRWAMHGNRFRAAREAGRAGQVVAILIGAFGLVLTVGRGGGVWLLVTAAFLWANARFEIAAANMSERLDGIQVRDLTWLGVAAAGPDMDADSMLWQRRRLGAAGGVSVTDASGHPVGMVLERDLWSIPSEERPWVMLTQMMVPFDRTTRAHLDESLSALLPRLNPAHPIVTVWDNDRLVGMIPPNRLDEHLGW